MAALPPDVRSALTRIAELVEAYEEDDARQLFAELNERVASDRTLAITTHQTLADELARAGHEEFATFARCRATLAAADDLTRWVELLIESVVTLVGDFQREAADELVAELASRTSHDRALAFSSRLRLAHALVQAWEVTGAIRELKAMLQLELSDDQRLEVSTALVRSQHGWAEDDGERARATAQLGSLLAASSSSTPVELRVRGHLELALTEASLHHASTAAELARTSRDLELRRRANKQYAELLFDAGDLARAEGLLSGFTNDEELDARALLEHIGRRRGTLAPPPPEAFAEVPRLAGDAP